LAEGTFSCATPQLVHRALTLAHRLTPHQDGLVQDVFGRRLRWGSRTVTLQIEQGLTRFTMEVIVIPALPRPVSLT